MPITKEVSVNANGPQVILGSGDITTDAWGRPKFVQDFTLFHSLFTYEVPEEHWYELINGVEQSSFVNASGVNGKLHLTSGATLNDDVMLRTFRNPRYEPNRGLIYSVSLFLPNPDAAAIRRFGIGTPESAVFYELNHGTLKRVRRTTVDSVTTDYAETITDLPDGLDLAKGCTFDIQMQWRGVGDYFWYAGDLETRQSALIAISKNLNSSTELSCFNPAMPVFFECINEGDEAIIEAGCVDVSAEGGRDSDGTYGAITVETDSGSVAITGFNQLVMAIHNKYTVGTLINTRDVQNLSLAAYSDQRSVVRVWVTRNPEAITLGTQTWVDFRDGHLEYLVVDPAAGTPAVFVPANADLQYSARVNIDETFVTEAIFQRVTQLWLAPGDYLIFTMHRETGTGCNAGVTYEFSEMI